MHRQHPDKKYLNNANEANPMAFWERKSEEEIEKDLQERDYQKKMDMKLRSLDRFPGSLEEYAVLKREERTLLSMDIIVPMHIERPMKFIIDPCYSRSSFSGISLDGERDLLISLINKGCIGLIRYVLSSYQYSESSTRCTWTGIPVMVKVPETPPYR